MVLHIMINDEIFNGLKMIKYSVNHPWKFSNTKMAFAAGLLQVGAMILISIINFLVIASSDSVLDVAKDFTALAIIADFDDIFAEGLTEEKAKDVCENEDGIYDDIFRIETTTSIDARGEMNEKIVEDPIFDLVNNNRRKQNLARTYKIIPEECVMYDSGPKLLPNLQKKILKRPKTIRIDSSDRDWENWILFYTYRFLRTIHVTVWFYCLPFIFLMTLYFVPILNQYNDFKDNEAAR